MLSKEMKRLEKNARKAAKLALPPDWEFMDTKERVEWERTQPAKHVWGLSIPGCPLVQLSTLVEQQAWFDIRGAIEFAPTVEQLAESLSEMRTKYGVEFVQHEPTTMRSRPMTESAKPSHPHAA